MYSSTKTCTCLKEKRTITHTHTYTPANKALCLIILPSTSTRLLVDVVMLMRICSDCSCRRRGFARFFHTPQICTDTNTQAGELGKKAHLASFRTFSARQTDNTSAKYIQPCDCALHHGADSFPVSSEKKCGRVPAPHNFQFRSNLHFN